MTRPSPNWIEYGKDGKVVRRRWYGDTALSTPAELDRDPLRPASTLPPPLRNPIVGRAGVVIIDDPVGTVTPAQIEAARELFLAPTLFERMAEAQRLPAPKPPRPRRAK